MIRHRLAVAAPLLILGAACQPAALPDNESPSGPDRRGTASAYEAPAPQGVDTCRDTPSQGVPAVEAPRRDLAWDEARGGHTLARHVGLSDTDLRARLAAEDISAASTFVDRETAERVVAGALEASRTRVQRWSRRRGRRPNLVVHFRGDPSKPIGRSLQRGARGPRTCWSARIVLRWDEDEGRFFVLTAYPEVSR